MYIGKSKGKGLAGDGQLATVRLPSSDTNTSTPRSALKVASFEKASAESTMLMSDGNMVNDACSSGDESVSSLHTGDIGYNEEGGPTYLLSQPCLAYL